MSTSINYAPVTTTSQYMRWENDFVLRASGAGRPSSTSFKHQYSQDISQLQERARANQIKELMIIRKAHITSIEYGKAIRRIREQFEGIEKKQIDHTSIRKLHDNSISIGLCGYYIASTSMKLKCPFDIRFVDADFREDIMMELDPKNKYNFNQTERTIPRCTKFCRFTLCGEDTFVRDGLSNYVLSAEKYEKIIVKSLKNFVVKI